MTSENTYTSINNFINTISASNINRALTFDLKHFPDYFYVYYEYFDKQSRKIKGKIEAQFEFTPNTTYKSIIDNLISEQQLTQKEKQTINKYSETSNNGTELRGFLKIILNHLNETNNIVCTNKTFYNDSNYEIFKEIFAYRDKQYLMENERRVSYIFDIGNHVIGFGFYENYNVFGNLLIAVDNDKEVNVINCGIAQDQLASISEDINRKSYFGGFGISIKAKAGGSYDCLYELNEKCKADRNNKFCILPIVPSYDELNTIIPKNITNYNYLKESFGFSEERYNNKKFALLPIRCNKHSSVLIINLKKEEFHSFDSSLEHRDPRDCSKLDENIFGNYLKTNTKPLINNSNLQFNGTCTYWSDAFCEVVVTSPEYNGSNGEDGLENIKRDCANGTMFLKCAKSIGRIFDKDLNLPTVKIYEDQNVDNNNYYNFTINGKNYGISKTSGLNKFVNLETLVETLGTEEEKRNGIMSLPDEQGKKEKIKDLLKNQIEGQKKIREKEREIFNFEQLEKTKKAYEDFVNKEIESINTAIDNSKHKKGEQSSSINNEIDNLKKKFEEDISNLNTEKTNFLTKFDECKRLYGSVDDWKNEYNELKEKVRRNESIITNPTGLDTTINNLVTQIQDFDIMNRNKYRFDFRSEAGEVVNKEEVRTIDEIEQPKEAIGNQGIVETELNRTTTKKTTEAGPSTPNPQTTNPLSNISVVVPTNVENSANPRPPTDLKNHDKKTTEKTMV